MQKTLFNNYRIKRGGSRGFVLNDDSLDEGFYVESLNKGQNWLEKYENKFSKNGEQSLFFVYRFFQIVKCLII